MCECVKLFGNAIENDGFFSVPARRFSFCANRIFLLLMFLFLFLLLFQLLLPSHYTIVLCNQTKIIINSMKSQNIFSNLNQKDQRGWREKNGMSGK